MKKTGIIIDAVQAKNPELLSKIKSDFVALGAEIVFFAEFPGGLAKSLSELRNFDGPVVNLANAETLAETGRGKEDSADSFSQPDVNETRGRQSAENIDFASRSKPSPRVSQPDVKGLVGTGKSSMVEFPSGVENLKLTVEGVFLDKSGYALHTRNMALGLHKAGADIQLKNLWFAGAPEIAKVDRNAPREDGYIYLTKDDGSLHRYKSQVDPVQTQMVVELCRKECNPADRILIAALPPFAPTDEIYRKIIERGKKGEKYRKYIGYTMFETADLPHGWADALNLMDEIWVPSSFNYDSFIRGGVPKAKMRIVPLGVDTDFFNPGKTPAMQIPGVKSFNFLSIFQWTKRKGWDILLKAYLKAFSCDDDVALVIRSYKGAGREVETAIREYIEDLGRDINTIPRISVISEPIPSHHMPSLYKACSAFVLPTRGEGWGLPFMEAMAMGLPVIGTRYSAQLDFMNDNNSFLIDNLGVERVDEEQIMDDPQYMGTSWGIPSLDHTVEIMRYVYENRGAAQTKGNSARQDILANWTVSHQVLRTAQVLLSEAPPVSAQVPEPVDNRKIEMLARLDAVIGRLAGAKPDSQENKPVPAKKRPLKIVMANRPNSLEAPGGDTVVMQNLKRELEKMGHSVDFQFRLEDMSGYDIAHIFNFVLPEMIKLYADNAQKYRKPIVMTPMYEDWPLFLNQSFKSYYIFKEYLEKGQPRALFDELAQSLKRLKPHHSADNRYNVRLAGGITPSGASEAERIKREYPYSRNVLPVYLGCDVTENDIPADLFIRETGLKDFVFCVARLETRKNQLMLLKALEEEDIPVVFATGGFTYQLPYAKLCQNFRRKGQTLFLGRLSDEMLVSAYRAAKVHALPSWYELPGMVSVEAAHYDCNVVASKFGTIEDYLGDYAYYCHPGDPEDIRKAVLRALQEPIKPGLKQHVRQFTWRRAAEKTLEAYENAMEAHNEVLTLNNRAESAKKAGDYLLAMDFLKDALEIHPDNPDILNSAAELSLIAKSGDTEVYAAKLRQLAVERDTKTVMNIPLKLDDWFVFEEYTPSEEALNLLEQGALNPAEEILRREIDNNPSNSLALYGMGLIQFKREKFAEARAFLQKSVDVKASGDSLIALAETLEKLNLCDEALTSLKLIYELPGINGHYEFDINRLKGHCLLKQGRFDEAEGCYHRAHNLDSASEKPFLGLGSLELLKKNFNAADQYYRKALELNPHSDKARLGLSALRCEQNRVEEAFDEAVKALELRLENQQAMMMLIKTGYQTGRLSEIEKYLAKYSQLHPANVEILFTLAGVRYKLGLVNDALEMAQRILLFHPGHPDALQLIDEIEKSAV